MIKYIGPQLNSAIIAANNEEYSLEEQFIKYIDLQAFAVLPLKGQTFTVDSDEKLSQGLEAFLFCLFPGIDWTDVDVSPGPVRKYNFLHTSIPAPENEATHQPMSIEIRGGIKDLSGDPGTYAGALSEIWPLESEESHSRWRQIRREYSLEDELPKLIGRLTLEIWEAVYSIVMFPNVTGGVYL
jgi:hypothetical protein